MIATTAAAGLRIGDRFQVASSVAAYGARACESYEVLRVGAARKTNGSDGRIRWAIVITVRGPVGVENKEFSTDDRVVVLQANGTLPLEDD